MIIIKLSAIRFFTCDLQLFNALSESEATTKRHLYVQLYLEMTRPVRQTELLAWCCLAQYVGIREDCIAYFSINLMNFLINKT